MSYLTGPELAEIENLLTGLPDAEFQDDPAGFCRFYFGEYYTDEVIRVMESVRDNQVTVAQSANAVGKTHCAARLAVWFYKCFPGAQVYTAAAPPEDNLRRLLWGEIGGLVERHRAMFAGDRVKDLQVSRGAREFVTGVTIPASGTPAEREARFSGKHAPAIFFIVDEGDAVPDEVYRGIESCMSGGLVRLLVMFNPRAKSGPVYRMGRDRLANVVSLTAFNHPNVVTGQNVIPGAVDREKTVRRINQWSRPLAGGEKPDAECFEVPEFLAGVTAVAQDGGIFPPLAAGWRRITDPALSYMVLGDYPAQGTNQLISTAWIQAARARWDVYVSTHGEVGFGGVRPVLGVDVADMGADSSVIAVRAGGWLARLLTRRQQDPDLIADWGIGVYNDLRAEAAFVDATGVGAGVAPKMQRQGCQAHRVMVASTPTEKIEQGEFGTMRDQLWWSVREWLRANPNAMLPPDEQLTEELSVPTYEVRGGKIRVMSKDAMKLLLKRSPDRADALGLTFAVSTVHRSGKI